MHISILYKMFTLNLKEENNVMWMAQIAFEMCDKPKCHNKIPEVLYLYH